MQILLAGAVVVGVGLALQLVVPVWAAGAVALAGGATALRAVIVPADAPARRADDGAAVRLEQTGETYSVTFVRS